MKNQSRFKKELSSLSSYLWANDYNGVIYFDHKSYDDNRDIPHLLIDGELVYVVKFYVNREETLMQITDDENKVYTLDLTELPEEWNDDYFDQIGMFELLQDVYYETTESYEIGDYEIDFLKE